MTVLSLTELLKKHEYCNKSRLYDRSKFEGHFILRVKLFMKLPRSIPERIEIGGTFDLKIMKKKVNTILKGQNTSYGSSEQHKVCQSTNSEALEIVKGPVGSLCKAMPSRTELFNLSFKLNTRRFLCRPKFRGNLKLVA